MTFRKALALTAYAVFLFPSLIGASGGPTSGADFLSMDEGGRAIGMAGAYTAIATDSLATYWNPAGLAQIPWYEVTLQHNQWIQDLSYEYVSFGMPLWRYGGLGISATMLYMPSFNNDPANLTDANAQDIAGSLSYGQRIFNPIEFGFTAKYIQRTLLNYTATAYAGDVGLHADLFDNFQFGAAVQNIGTPVTFISEADPLPLTYRAGLAFYLVSEDNDLTIDVDGVEPANTNTFYGSVGGELTLYNQMALRGGYHFNRDINTYAVGVGLKEPTLILDVFYDPLVNLGDSYGASLTIRFGEGVEYMKKGLLLPPSGLVAEAGKEKLFLHWDQAKYREFWGYNVYYAVAFGKTFHRINKVRLMDNDLIIKKVPAEEKFIYAVSVLIGENGENESDLSMPVRVIAEKLPPAKPTEVSVVPMDGGARIQWKPSQEPGVTGYNVYVKRMLGETPQKLNIDMLRDHFFIAQGLKNDTPYYFSVTTVNGNHKPPLESDFSEDVSAVPASIYATKTSTPTITRTSTPTLTPTPEPPKVSAPQGLDITQDKTAIILSWNGNPPTDAILGYFVYYSNKPDSNFYRINSSPLNQVSLRLKKGHLQQGKTYYYAITAVGLDGRESNKSAIVGVVIR